MKRSRELTLKKLREAARVNYKTVPVRTINEIKRLFLKSIKRDSLTFIKIPVHKRFLFFYIWHVYFRMLSWDSFVDILNELCDDSILQSYIKKEDRITRSVHGGIFGITISAIVAGIAAAASKAAVTATTAAAVIGSSTAASTIASSVAGGVGGALAGAVTEAIIKT